QGVHALRDNGAGVAVILEAARIFKRLGLRPKHTIRFLFFSGEEELSNGSRAYVAQHKNELDDARAVFNIDCGALQPLGFRIHGRTDLEAVSRRLLKPLVHGQTTDGCYGCRGVLLCECGATSRPKARPCGSAEVVEENRTRALMQARIR